MAGTQALRQIMGQRQFGARVNYGDCLFSQSLQMNNIQLWYCGCLVFAKMIRSSVMEIHSSKTLHPKMHRVWRPFVVAKPKLRLWKPFDVAEPKLGAATKMLSLNYR
eukprot:11269648-Karenia_brevis.AAC.1